jgi:hypothetical protein
MIVQQLVLPENFIGYEARTQSDAALIAYNSRIRVPLGMGSSRWAE